MTDPEILRLSLTSAGSVMFEVTPEQLPALRSLQISFPGAEAVGRSGFELDLGPFLANLAALARWQGGSVQWSPNLQEVTERALDDGDLFELLVRGDSDVGSADAPQSLEPDWRGDLTPLQYRDLARLLNMRHGANFSVPGAGKTRVALAFLSTLRERGVVESAIVVAPKSAHESWVVETATVFEGPREVVVYQGGPIPKADIVLINYERLPGARSAVAASLTMAPRLLVLDEAHRMKRGAMGAYGSACLSLGPLAAYRLVLSGTPAPNGISDLRSVMEFAWPGKGTRLLGNSGADWSKPTSVALAPLFTRTTKKDLDLPKLDVVKQPVELPPIHREIYDALLGQFRSPIPAAERVDDLGKIIVYLLMAATSPALLAVGSSRYEPLQFRVPPFKAPPSGALRSLLADLPQFESSPKLQAAVDIASRNAALGRKTLIWSTFIRNLTTIQSMAPHLGAEIVTGSATDEERAERIARFRRDPSCFVLLSNPSTLGEGVSLHHECHEAVYVDRDFAAGRFLQSIDRIHRLGLRPDVVTRATVLISSNTIDNLVEDRLRTKLLWMTDILNDSGLAELADLEEERENGEVITDLADASAVWAYLGRG
jgi:SNF2 family DNA or RNA helicase